MTRPRAPSRAGAPAAVALLLAAAGAAADVVLEARPFALSSAVAPGDGYMGIRHLGALELRGRGGRSDPVSGLSGLAWDDDEGILYAISDRGHVLHLVPRFEDGRLVGARARAAHRLRDERGHPLLGAAADAEGLAVLGGANGRRGDSRLLIAFERDPRVVLHAPDGTALGPARLRVPRYRFANANKAFEAVIADPAGGDGDAIAAVEWPLAGDPAGVATLISTRGATWRWRLRDLPHDGLVGLERLPGGRLLVLERSYGLLLFPLVLTLRVSAPLPAAGGPLEAERTAAVLDTSRGWAADNFEGLARHRQRRFFMVSDDNARPYQRTLLFYFELLPPGEWFEPEAAPAAQR